MRTITEQVNAHLQAKFGVVYASFMQMSQDALDMILCKLVTGETRPDLLSKAERFGDRTDEFIGFVNSFERDQKLVAIFDADELTPDELKGANVIVKFEHWHENNKLVRDSTPVAASSAPVSANQSAIFSAREVKKAASTADLNPGMLKLIYKNNGGSEKSANNIFQSHLSPQDIIASLFAEGLKKSGLLTKFKDTTAGKTLIEISKEPKTDPYRIAYEEEVSKLKGDSRNSGAAAANDEWDFIDDDSEVAVSAPLLTGK